MTIELCVFVLLAAAGSGGCWYCVCDWVNTAAAAASWQRRRCHEVIVCWCTKCCTERNCRSVVRLPPETFTRSEHHVLSYCFVWTLMLLTVITLQCTLQTMFQQRTSHQTYGSNLINLNQFSKCFHCWTENQISNIGSTQRDVYQLPWLTTLSLPRAGFRVVRIGPTPFPGWILQKAHQTQGLVGFVNWDVFFRGIK